MNRIQGCCTDLFMVDFHNFHCAEVNVNVTRSSEHKVSKLLNHRLLNPFTILLSLFIQCTEGRNNCNYTCILFENCNTMFDHNEILTTGLFL